jgi:hypothetical protein
MQKLVSLALILSFMTPAFGQMSNNGPGPGKDNPGNMGPGNQGPGNMGPGNMGPGSQGSGVDISQLDFTNEDLQCPFEINMEEILPSDYMTQLQNLNAQLQALNASNKGDCNFIGEQLAQMITNLTPPKDDGETNPPGGNGMGPGPGGNGMGPGPGGNGMGPGPGENGMGPGPGENGNGEGMGNGEGNPNATDDEVVVEKSDPEAPKAACVENPQLCANNIQQIIAGLSSGQCKDFKGSILKNVVSVTGAIGQVTGNPYLMFGSMGVGVVADMIELFKGKTGIYGTMNKLEKQQMKAMERSLEGIAACAANQAYLDSVCSLQAIKEKLDAQRGDPEYKKKLSSYYECMRREEKTPQQCQESSGIDEDELTKAYTDFIAQKSGSYQFATQNQLRTLLRAGERFHNRRLKQLKKDLKQVKRKEKKYDQYGDSNSITLYSQLYQHCYHGFLSAQTDEKNPVFIKNELSSFEKGWCEKLDSCINKINDSSNSQFKTFNDFKYKKRVKRTLNVCIAVDDVNKMSNIEVTEVADYLVKAGFDQNGRCDIRWSYGTAVKKEEADENSSSSEK